MIDDDFPPRLRTQSNARVQRLLEQVARDGPSNAQVAATVAGVGHAIRAAKWLKIAVAIGSTGVLAASVAVAIHMRHTPPANPIVAVPTEIVTPREIAPEPTATLEPPVETTTPIALPRAKPRAPAPATSSDEDGSSMSAELQRVLAIRASMLSKDAASALRGAEGYEHDYPNGSFLPEAEAMSIEALHDLGRTGEAKTRAGRFLARYGNSPQAVRIRALDEKMGP